MSEQLPHDQDQDPGSPPLHDAANNSSALRDRTDEMELIISSLTMVALFTVPGWLFKRFAEDFTHWSIPIAIGGQVALLFVTGLCYVLGGCFLLHLLTRAYWIGLIGLRTVFPEGINWSRTPGIGPLTRQHYRQTLPDLSAAIDRADRLASSLFAIISLIAMSTLWLAILFLVTAITAGAIGERFGATNRALSGATFGVLGVAIGLPLLLWLLDAQLGARMPRLQKSRAFQGILVFLRRCNGVLFPHRLILPVRLTLQSNTRPLIFIVAFAVGIFAVIYIGMIGTRYRAAFTVSNEFIYLTHTDIDGGVRSSHYRDQYSDRDRMSPQPMIPSFEQSGGFVQLFLPYWPLRDNPMLEQRCDLDDDSALGAPCLQQLWAVSLNDRPVDMATFMATELRDLRLRGLTGVIELAGARPGIQYLDVVWNPLGMPEGSAFDDRYTSATVETRIPFLFAPPFEQGLDEFSGATPAAAELPGSSESAEASDPSDQGSQPSED